MHISGSYKVIFRDLATGAKAGEITRFIALTYAKEVNNETEARIVVPVSDPNIPAFTKNMIVEVWRRFVSASPVDDTPWYQDWLGVYRGQEQNQLEEGQAYFTICAKSILHILTWRVVAWKSTDGIVDNRTYFFNQASETIAKTLVTYNCTASATVANGRLKNGQIPNITVAPDGGFGTVRSFNTSEVTVLEAVQDLCKTGGGDIDIAQNGVTNLEFRWYRGQRGSDRTTGNSTVVFSTNLGNIRKPHYQIDYNRDKTAAIVGGLGTCNARRFQVVTGNSFVSQTNDYEIFVDARQSNNSAVDVGNIELYNNRARDNLTFEVLQVPGLRYGKHYNIGDLCIATYDSGQSRIPVITKTVKIQQISISVVGNEKEQISVTTRTL